MGDQEPPSMAEPEDKSKYPVGMDRIKMEITPQRLKWFTCANQEYVQTSTVHVQQPRQYLFQNQVHSILLGSGRESHQRCDNGGLQKPHRCWFGWAGSSTLPLAVHTSPTGHMEPPGKLLHCPNLDICNAENIGLTARTPLRVDKTALNMKDDLGIVYVFAKKAKPCAWTQAQGELLCHLKHEHILKGASITFTEIYLEKNPKQRRFPYFTAGLLNRI